MAAREWPLSRLGYGNSGPRARGRAACVLQSPVGHGAALGRVGAPRACFNHPWGRPCMQRQQRNDADDDNDEDR